MCESTFKCLPFISVNKVSFTKKDFQFFVKYFMVYFFCIFFKFGITVKVFASKTQSIQSETCLHAVYKWLYIVFTLTAD